MNEEIKNIEEKLKIMTERVDDLEQSLYCYLAQKYNRIRCDKCYEEDPTGNIQNKNLRIKKINKEITLYCKEHQESLDKL